MISTIEVTSKGQAVINKPASLLSAARAISELKLSAANEAVKHFLVIILVFSYGLVG
jgi:hypothetical protein